MPKKLFRPPENLVKEWPEVFDDLYMNTMPVAYLEFIRLEFSNGRIWEIDIQDQISESQTHVVSERLLETFQEYKDEIIKVDFKVDVSRLKTDILNSTNRLF